eukprot:scaffold200694_cov31-Tisochrysis_lutea.AAC.1
MHLVIELSGGRHFPRSQSVGFVVRAQLIGQQRTSCVSRGVDAPFWGDIFAWELSPALLRQLQASTTPSLKLQVVMTKGDSVGRVEQPLGHVNLQLKGVRYYCSRSLVSDDLIQRRLFRAATLAGTTCSASANMAHSETERWWVRPLQFAADCAATGDSCFATRVAGCSSLTGSRFGFRSTGRREAAGSGR